MKKILPAFLFFIFASNYSKAQCAGNCTLYTTASVAYAPTSSVGTAVVLGDDQLSAPCNIGFTFTFMCTARTQFLISSNGFITFDLAATNSGCCSGLTIPSPGSTPNDMIAWDWNDLYPPGGGAITYTTIGTAPNRICIITYTNIPHCCNNGPSFNSAQIKLFETTNNIEIHSGVITSDGSTATQGIENASGNVAYAVTGRNGVTWTANGDAYKFSPAAAQPSCTGAPVAGSAIVTPSSACGSATVNLSLTGTSGTCGATYQWQVATNIAGPYTNIAGATTLTAQTTATVTSYYRCVLACAGQTAASAVATESITAPPCPAGIGVWYINSNAGQPWGTTSNFTSLNTVFSNTWTQGYFETVNVAAAFNQTTCLVYLEGGDFNATAMNTFVTNNLATIQTWVSNGGHLIMNAAPNQGGNMTWGFGGVLLNYATGPYSTTGNAAPGQNTHPIFVGPYTPITTSYTGNYWCHGYVTGPGTTLVIGQTPGASLTWMNYGSGKAMFGSMTTPNWHTPLTEAQNFLSNILSYMYGCTLIPLPVEMGDIKLSYNGEYADLSWTTFSEKNTDYFLVEKSYDGINYSYFDKVSACGYCRGPRNYSTHDLYPDTKGTTWYRLKQFDKGSSVPAFSEVRILNLRGGWQIKVQPNPASTNLLLTMPDNIRSQEVNIQVFDQTGRRVLSQQVAKSNQVNLNIEDLQTGLYIIQVYDQTGVSSKCTFIKN